MAKTTTKKKSSPAATKKTSTVKADPTDQQQAWHEFRKRVYAQVKEDNPGEQPAWWRKQVSDMWKVDSTNPKNSAGSPSD